ncbi:MAG TPA: flagellar export protein FliJ [bacterium]|nr:flagellar export protein FliJ [bacterium]
MDQVLGYRRQLENLSIRKMAEAQGQRQRIQDDLARGQDARNETADWFSGEERQGSFPVEQAALYVEYMEFLSGQEKALRRREKEAEAEVEKRRAEVVAAAKKRRLLEALREKKLAAHEAEVSREEQAFLDDVSSIAFIRRDRASRARRAF